MWNGAQVDLEREKVYFDFPMYSGLLLVCQSKRGDEMWKRNSNGVENVQINQIKSEEIW